MGNNTDANRSEITTLPERVDGDAMPHKFDIDVEMKPDLGENIGLNPLHLKLIYRMETRDYFVYYACLYLCFELY